MAEGCFSIKNRSVLRVRLEPTEIFGMGSAAFPILTLQLKLQLLPAQLDSIVNYTLVRLAGKFSAGNDNTELASFEAPPLAETSNINTYERQLSLNIPLNIRQIKRIEELRDGKNPYGGSVVENFWRLLWRESEMYVDRMALGSTDHFPIR
ncbi:MAG: hypothetical protein WB781_27010 [Candidatus Sulfotelmatobacter sp.]